MKITLDGYADNPMGKRNAVFSQRDLYRGIYSEKWGKVILRENGRVDVALYTSKDGKYYMHLKIPSEVIKKFYYDVVIEFYTDDNAIKATRSLKDYYVRFYSNDPNFVFTFAHAFIKNDMFITQLEPKMSKLAVKQKAKEKNPKELIGYVKSIYFAYLYIKSKGLLNKVHFESYGSKINFKDLMTRIEHADKKIADRQKAQEDIDRAEKEKKDKLQQQKKQVQSKPTTDSNNTKSNITQTKRVSSVVSKGGTVSKVKKIIKKR